MIMIMVIMVWKWTNNIICNNLMILVVMRHSKELSHFKWWVIWRNEKYDVYDDDYDYDSHENEDYLEIIWWKLWWRGKIRQTEQNLANW